MQCTPVDRGVSRVVVFNRSYLEIGISKHFNFSQYRPIIGYPFRSYKSIYQNNPGNNLNLFSKLVVLPFDSPCMWIVFCINGSSTEIYQLSFVPNSPLIHVRYTSFECPQLLLAQLSPQSIKRDSVPLHDAYRSHM